MAGEDETLRIENAEGREQRAKRYCLKKSSNVFNIVLYALCSMPYALRNQYHIYIRYIRAGWACHDQVVQRFKKVVGIVAL